MWSFLFILSHDFILLSARLLITSVQTYLWLIKCFDFVCFNNIHNVTIFLFLGLMLFTSYIYTNSLVVELKVPTLQVIKCAIEHDPGSVIHLPSAKLIWTLRSMLMLSYNLLPCLRSRRFPKVFLTKILYAASRIRYLHYIVHLRVGNRRRRRSPEMSDNWKSKS
jgi:hypothetical protein